VNFTRKEQIFFAKSEILRTFAAWEMYISRGNSPISSWQIRIRKNFLDFFAFSTKNHYFCDDNGMFIHLKQKKNGKKI